MTEEEKKRLEALESKTDLTAEEKTELEALKAKAASAEEKTFSEEYVKSLRQEAAKYRTAAKEKEEQLAKFANIDLDEYEKLKKEAQEAERKKLAAAGEFDKLKQQLIDQHNNELGKKEEEKAALQVAVQKLESELTSTILGHEISVAATVAQAINPKLVEMVAVNSMKVETLENGKRVIRVLDGAGHPRIDIKTGQPITVSQYLDEMKQMQEYAHLFSGGKAGAGSGTLLFGGQNIQNPWKKETFNLTLQGKIMKENPEMAARLKGEAGVAVS